jgi:hypothetical protein
MMKCPKLFALAEDRELDIRLGLCHIVVIFAFRQSFRNTALLLVCLTQVANNILIFRQALFRICFSLHCPSPFFKLYFNVGTVYLQRIVCFRYR